MAARTGRTGPSALLGSENNCQALPVLLPALGQGMFRTMGIGYLDMGREADPVRIGYVDHAAQLMLYHAVRSERAPQGRDQEN